MKVKSNKDVYFPKLNWGISKGDVKELPASKEAQEQILAHNAIAKVSDAPVSSHGNNQSK